jgi:hypothetical protein
MRRPARPFVVEVKKKRGNLAKRHSIWGDLDLAAIASDPLRDPTGDSEQAARRHKVDPVLAVDRVDALEAGPETTSNSKARDSVGVGPQIDQHHAPVETEELAEEPSRRFRKRARRRDEPTLPRGQRWKRRLPKALRR